MLQINLLTQFRLIIRAEQANRLELSDLALNFNANDENNENKNEAENKQDNTYPSSENTGTSQAESML